MTERSPTSTGPLNNEDDFISSTSHVDRLQADGTCRLCRLIQSVRQEDWQQEAVASRAPPSPKPVRTHPGERHREHPISHYARHRVSLQRCLGGHCRAKTPSRIPPYKTPGEIV